MIIIPFLQNVPTPNIINIDAAVGTLIGVILTITGNYAIKRLEARTNIYTSLSKTENDKESAFIDDLLSRIEKLETKIDSQDKIIEDVRGTNIKLQQDNIGLMRENSELLIVRTQLERERNLLLDQIKDLLKKISELEVLVGAKNNV